ncbi:MAPEG family protein [Bacteriovoracaceae bacterium]|nr:MAPEG family protein [Bacteriovoracaceae bacterium]|tara:strand:- start:415205 stop:415618 length:414 start_codon:yes stop_codon:yes gene_type:complete
MNFANILSGGHTLYLPAAVTTIVFLLAWLPSSIAKYQQKGTKFLLGNRSDTSALSGWGGRSIRAYENWKSYFPGYIMAVVLLSIKGGITPLMVNLCWAYLGARVLHMMFYCMGNPTLRFLSFLVSMVINFYLLFKLM